MLDNEEYYEIIQKESPKTALEEKEIQDYENYIRMVKRYAPYLNEDALENLTTYQRF